MKEFDDFYLYIETRHKRLLVNVFRLSPKKEINSCDNDETLINKRTQSMKLNEIKVEPCFEDFKWDNDFVDIDYVDGEQSKPDYASERNDFSEAENVPNEEEVPNIANRVERNVFPCNWCEKVYLSKPGRNKHCSTAHKTIFECDLCGAR